MFLKKGYVLFKKGFLTALSEKGWSVQEEWQEKNVLLFYSLLSKGKCECSRSQPSRITAMIYYPSEASVTWFSFAMTDVSQPPQRTRTGGL